MTTYGESLKAVTEEGDGCQRFFTTIATFSKNFHNAMDDNIKRRMNEVSTFYICVVCEFHVSVKYLRCVV